MIYLHGNHEGLRYFVNKMAVVLICDFFLVDLESLNFLIWEHFNPKICLAMLIGKSFVCYSKIDRDPVSVLLEVKGKPDTLLFESGAIAELCK